MGPTRDPLDVGLNRRPSKKQLPTWVEEYWVLLALGGAVLFILLPLQLLRVFNRPPPPPPPAPASLSIVYGPAKVWAEGSSSTLRAVEIKVKNRGPNPAYGVAVSVTVHNNVLTLRGPERLEVEQIAGYRIDNLSLSVNSQDTLTPQVTCGNCSPAQ